jgi:hypothetical protein
MSASLRRRWREDECGGASGSRRNRGDAPDILETIVQTQWDDPIDLQKLDPALRKKLLKAAPFLMGRRAAKYDEKWFASTLGLCSDGPLPTKISESECPASSYASTWPYMDDDNKSRFPLDKCRDPTARDTYLALYKNIYGEKPDNGCISISFLRGAYMFYGRNKAVNWAGHASKVYTERLEHPAKNPMKLSPPAPMLQVQAIVNILGAAVAQGGGGDKAASASGGSSVSLEKLTSKLQASLDEVKQLAATLDTLNEKQNSVQTQLNACDAKDLELDAQHRTLKDRSARLGKLAMPREKAEVDEAARDILMMMVANNEEIDQLRAKFHKLEAQIDAKYLKWAAKNEESEVLKKQVETQRLAAITIRPKCIFDKLPTMADDTEGPLSKACPGCCRFFLKNVAVPFSCGCMYHPHCLWEMLVVGHRYCPRCGEKASGIWMASWGFPLDKGMKVEVEVAGEDQTAWAKPLGPNRFVPTTPPTQDFEVRKRTTSAQESKPVRGKRIRVNGPKLHEDSGAPSPNYVLVDLEDPIPPSPEPINIAPLAVVPPDTAIPGGRTSKGFWAEEGSSRHKRRASGATPSVSEEAQAIFNTGLIDRLVETVISLAD